MRRREFLRLIASAAPAARIGSRALFAQSANLNSHTYEITTRVQVLKPSGPTTIWLPLPIDERVDFQKVVSHSIDCAGGKSSVHEDKLEGLRMVVAKFPAGSPAVLTMTQQVSTRDRSVPLTARLSGVKEAGPHDASQFLRPTHYVPTDGIVKATANKITAGATSDVDKVHAIYEWIVENTFRDPKVRGCGRGDIRPMLEMGDLGGKCADLNALFVGLVKASGVPARDVYGIRLGKSSLDCRSLGTSSEKVEKAQHCRAEVFLNGFGWVPMDPADVRKVVLEEPPGNLTLSDSKVQGARKRLFGSWEMNWMAYNFAQDVKLPGSTGPALAYFMYPQAETNEGRLDSLDPENFHYEITSREV
jgi:transglutaminase-like putative cysteine protease